MILSFFVAGKQIECEVKNISPNTKQSITWCEDEIKRRFSPDAHKKYVFVSCTDSLQRTAKIDLMHNGISQIYIGNSKVLYRYNNLARRNLYRNYGFLILVRYIKKLISDSIDKPRVYGSDSRYYVPFVYFDLLDYFKEGNLELKDVLPNIKLKELELKIKM